MGHGVSSCTEREFYRLLILTIMLSELTKHGGRNLVFLKKLGPNSLHILTAQDPPAFKGITNSIRIFEH